MDERILSARDAEKYDTRSGGFGAAEMGMLGVVAPNGVEFFYSPTRRNASTSEFDPDSIMELPQVDIHYSFAGSGGANVEKTVKGVVVATTGFTPPERNFYESLQRRGVVIATTFPSGQNIAAREASGVIAVERLSPVHARILLMLALTKTHDTTEIQRIFSEY
jgi:L-asparaginase/Glu-tRNA(Gln) amidotransferase subunit D